MDIGMFLAQLAAALAPHAAAGAGKVVEKIAEDVYGKAKDIIKALGGRLRGKPKAETALAKYEAEPDKAENQTALAQALQQEVEAQPEFQSELLALAQSLVDALQAANQRGAKYQIVANQIIGAGDNNTFNFYGAPPPPPEAKQT